MDFQGEVHTRANLIGRFLAIEFDVLDVDSLVGEAEDFIIAAGMDAVFEGVLADG